MKKVLIIIIVLLLTFFTLPLIFKYSEIKIQKIDKIDKNLFEDMKQKGFLPNCFPKNTNNILTAWNIDTNEFYMKFEIMNNEFLNFDQCVLMEKSEIKMSHKKGWITKIIYPYFVTEINEEIRTNKNLALYVSYKDYKLAKNEPFYILIDSDKKIGFAFSK